MEKRVYFTDRQAQRIVRAVKQVERGAGGRGGGMVRARGAISNPNGLQLCKTKAGGISARASSTMGSGTVELYNLDSDLEATASGIEFAVANMGGAIPADTFVLVDDGPWMPWVVVVPC